MKKLSGIDFLACGDFKEKRAAVLSKTGWGFIDTKGKTKGKLNYKKVGDFVNNRAIVETQKGRFGFINLDGKEIFKPKYKAVRNFKNGYALVKKRRKTKMIDSLGSRVSKSETRDIQIRNRYYSEVNYSEINTIDKRRNNQISDSIFNLLNIEFEAVGNFKDSIAVVALKKENKRTYNIKKYGLINKNGHYLSLPMASSFSNFVGNYAQFKYFSLNGLYDSEGNELLETKYGKIEVFDSNYLKISDLSKIFYLKIE